MKKESIPQSSILPDIYKEEVKRYAASGMSPDRIASLLEFTGLARTLFLERVCNPADVYYISYHAGQVERNYNIMESLRSKAETGDVEAVKTFSEAQQDIESLDLRKKLFGV